MQTLSTAKQKIVWSMALVAPVAAGVFSARVVSSFAPICSRGFKAMFAGKPLPALTGYVLSTLNAPTFSLPWASVVFGALVLLGGYLLVRSAPSAEDSTRRVLLLASCAWIVCMVVLLVCFVAFFLPMITLDDGMQGH